jgi:RsiW-degrading membrane proteinase PrsW (M82 family)
MDLIVIIILFLIAFVPPIFYVVWIRNTEHYERNPWSKIAKMFLWGAVVAVIISIIFYFVIFGVYGVFGEKFEREYEYLTKFEVRLVILICVIAPLIEEFTKGVGVYSVKNAITEVEDGLIYGAAAGLGFAATENLLYESTALLEKGLFAFIGVVIIRTIACSILHGSTSAIFGYGVSNKLVRGRNLVIPCYLLAVFVHGLFNFFVAFGLLFENELGNLAYIFGLLFAIMLAMFSIRFIRTKIRELDYVEMEKRYSKRELV